MTQTGSPGNYNYYFVRFLNVPSINYLYHLNSTGSQNFTTWLHRHDDRDVMDNNVGGVGYGGRNAADCSGAVSLLRNA